MAGAGYSVELQGGSQAIQKLGEAAARLDHAEPLFDLIGAMLVVSTRRRFETERAPGGNPWPQSIRARLDGGKTLTDSATLRNSMTHQATDAGVEVGTNTPYAAPNQFGAVIRPVSAKALRFTIGGRTIFAQLVTIPARPFLGIDEDDETAIEDITTKFVLEPFGQDSGAVDAH